MTTRVSGVIQNLKEVGTTKHYAEEHEVHMRQVVGVRRHKSLKPKTDTETTICRCNGDECERSAHVPGEILFYA